MVLPTMTLIRLSQSMASPQNACSFYKSKFKHVASPSVEHQKFMSVGYQESNLGFSAPLQLNLTIKVKIRTAERQKSIHWHVSFLLENRSSIILWCASLQFPILNTLFCSEPCYILWLHPTLILRYDLQYPNMKPHSSKLKIDKKNIP